VRLPQGKLPCEALGNEVAENLHRFRTSSRAQMKRSQITREPMPYGSVLIVDDVETNIYVAKGLMSPYGLKIDSAESGYAAIEKIKCGYHYDIIFMDHMMPKMDGIETTQLIRSMGYSDPVVALTANAVSGQADIFLGNGFDDFISKPIDVRQLNSILNRLIRDKQTAQTIEQARQHVKDNATFSDRQTANPAISPRFAEIFARDANKAITALDTLIEKNDFLDEANMRNYIIHVHGMKSALANIGKMDLSADALKLEMAGRENNLPVVIGDTVSFLASLRDFVKTLSPSTTDEDLHDTDEDTKKLRDALHMVKDACMVYDEGHANSILLELGIIARSPKSKALLVKLAELLLHSDFDEAIKAIDHFL
jgi:CheY-like chemotaxis protein/HPt (histidine-containing phosphotransfer) domain-containing protein